MPLEGDLQKSLEDSGLYSGQVDTLEKGGTLNFAQMTIRNPGRRKVEKIRIVMGEFPPTEVAVAEGGTGLRRLSEPKEVQLQPIEPGAVSTLYMWASFNMESKYYYDDWKTFSSEGPIRLNLKGDGLVGASKDDTVENVLEIALAISLLAMVVGLFIAYFAYSTYTTKLLSEKEFFDRERGRYQENPKKFRPKLE